MYFSEGQHTINYKFIFNDRVERKDKEQTKPEAVRMLHRFAICRITHLFRSIDTTSSSQCESSMLLANKRQK